MANSRKIRIGITQGDINGIGYEVILKTLQNSEILDFCSIVVYGSLRVANYHRKALEMPAIDFREIATAEELRDNSFNIVDVMNDDDAKVEFGSLSKTSGKAAFASLEQAVADLKMGLIDAIVTAPINKSSIQGENFDFPGHTEYLEASAGDGSKSLMILYNEFIKVALVTTHLPIAKIAESITKDLIVEKLQILNQSLIKDFEIIRPRIAVLGLNPHAGDDGLIGKEEKEIIAPAIGEAIEKGIMCFGPLAADGFFGSGEYKHFDAVLAMYHDQGLTAFKTLAMDSGVNYTAGLPFVRTSPDHGTGFDIAGKNMASEASFREAIFQAIDIVRTRRRHSEMTQNPLKKQYFDRSNDNVVLDLTKSVDEED